MMPERTRIGFDRELRLEWLDAVAAQAASGADVHMARRWLDGYLADFVGGDRHGGPRDKTIVKLCRIWITPPQSHTWIRDQAIQLLHDSDGWQRLALHWGMAMLAYPFFGSVADATGRLLSLQGDVERPSVIRRIYEAWGERPFVNRAARAVWNCFILWGVLASKREGNRVTLLREKKSPGDKVTLFLIEAALHWAGSRPVPVTSLASMPCLFPFDMSAASTVVRTSRRVHVSREGSEVDMVRSL